MFIVNLKNGKQLVEGSIKENGQPFTWDDIQNETGIANLSLAVPFQIAIKDNEGNVLKEFSPIASLGKYDRYFFYNEAVANVLVQGNKIKDTMQGKIVAKAIAGIDDKREEVIELKMDCYGNINVNRYPLKNLEEKIKNGQFRESTIKK